MAGCAGGIVQQAEHALGGATPEITDRLVHGRKTEGLGDGVAVEADDREISRDVDIQLTGDLEHSERHLVGKTEDRAGAALRRQGEHLPCGRRSAFDGVGTAEFDGGFESGLRNDPPKPLQPKS